MIADSGLIARLRLSSLDPREVPDRLLDLIAGSEDHLPAPAYLRPGGRRRDSQSDAAQLRHGVLSRFALARVRERLPDAALGSDIIVGFPGESDAQFENSLEYFASLPLTYFHVFPYSSRRGTAAAICRKHVPGPVKKARSAAHARARRAQEEARFCSSFLGRRVSVLIEEKIDRASGTRRGFSRNYLAGRCCRRRPIRRIEK